MSDDPLAALEAQLKTMSDRKLVQTVQVLEQAASHKAIQKALDAARPRLVQLRPTRRMTLMRLFCIPFEDFLTTRPVTKSETKRVSRSALTGLWRAFETLVPAEQMGKMVEHLRTINPEDRDALYALGTQVWALGAMILARAAKEKHPTLTEGDAPPLDQRTMAAQALLVSEILDVADPIQRMKAALPGKPIQTLMPSDREQVDALLAVVAQEKPERVGPFALALAHRVSRPADLLRVISAFSFWAFMNKRDHVTSEVASFTVDHVETDFARITAEIEDGNLNRSAMGSRLRSLLHDVTETWRTVRPKAKHPLYPRLKALLANLRDLVEKQMLKPSQETLLADIHRSRADHDFDPEALQLSEDAGRALKKMQKNANMLGIEKEIEGRLEEYEAAITSFAQKTMANMRPGNPALEKVQENFFIAIRLLETVANPETVGDLLEYGMIAMAELES